MKTLGLLILGLSEEDAVQAQKVIDEVSVPEELIDHLYAQAFHFAVFVCARIQRDSHDNMREVAIFVDQWILGVLREELKRINGVFVGVAKRSGYSWEPTWGSEYIDSLTADQLNRFFYSGQLH